MVKKLQLQIPIPCHENWENMTPVEKGRFCASCQKQVIDFSNMNDREVAMFFKKIAVPVCGRFTHDQLDRDFEIPRKRIPWVKYFFRFLLPAFLISMKAGAQKRKMTTKNPREIECTTTVGDIEVKITPDGDTAIAPIKSQVCENKSMVPLLGKINYALIKQPISQTTAIKGKVIDDTGGPVPYATLVIKGTKKAAIADSTGIFSIDPGTGWDNITIVISSVGLKTSEINLDRMKSISDLIIQLSTNANLGLVVVACTAGTHRKGMVCGSITTRSYSEISKKISSVNFKIYPNPLPSGSTLHIEQRQKEYGDHVLQLYNQSGQLVFTKDIYIAKEARLFSADLPLIQRGNYFLRITGKTTGKSYTEKLIIN
jgi:hypothetical protein